MGERSMNYIFISSKDGINKVGIVEDHRLVEYYTEEDNNEKLVGNVYRGRVENVLRGMGAAFVDIGVGKNAYLYVKDAYDKNQFLLNEKPTIDKVLKSGDEVMVQVTKEALGAKGAKVTTHISIPGRYLVLTPNSKDINISRKIDDNNEIKRLKIIGENIKKDDLGMIFRTNSEGVSEDLLKEEYNQLVNINSKIETQKGFLPTPKLIYKEMDLVYKIVRDTFNDRDYQIIVNNKEIDRITLTGNTGAEILSYPEIPGDHNTIEVRDQEIRMYEIDCPDQICVNTGFVSKPGQTIVCLHYNIIIEIVATGVVDVEDDMIISY